MRTAISRFGMRTSSSFFFSDFGLSRSLSKEKGEDLTEYVVTRFYRAPEIMLSSHEYSKAVDMWSAGCSLAEIMSGRVLFPGQHYIEQVNLIIGLRGTPDDNTKKQISNEYALKYIDSLPSKPKVPLAEMFPGAPADALDLLDKMLDMNPSRRITVEEALNHPFLETMHDPEDEPSFEGAIDFSFEEDHSLNLDKVKRLILREIASFNPAYYDLAA
jgi:serine/threonine protein kinase